MEEKLDEKDFALIEELRKDSKLSEQKLARKTSIPMTTVHNRLRKLRGLGVITGYTVRLDHAKLGRPLTAYVLLKVAPGADQKRLLAQIASMPLVCEAAIVAGSEFDIVLKARAASLKDLNDMVVEGLRGHRSVTDSRMMISYERFDNE
ncbi:MAG: Lrp/AsnC family transcriptional regulator [Candidatus Micrarchaeota archaeon]